MASCTDGQGYARNHDAEGWLVSPEHHPIAAMCRYHAEQAIREYRAVIDETWTFDAGNCE